ncbi:hypothetical protein Tco_0825303 [Tanacetum coccineum]
MSNWRRKKEMSKELQGCHKLNKRLILEKTTIFVGQGKELTCLQESAEIAESAEAAESAEIAESAEAAENAEDSRECRKFPKIDQCYSEC